jgi:Domain of unknown function (DUF397)
MTQQEFYWLRSSRCEHANCVEVAADSATIYVRDSKNPHPDRAIRLTRAEWAAFLVATKKGLYNI